MKRILYILLPLLLLCGCSRDEPAPDPDLGAYVYSEPEEKR